uniref:Uncharacterized protein n=1 Tax=Oryza nivara TaxID=4536 RepID=A0A0E0IAZ7_ORYNI
MQGNFSPLFKGLMEHVVSFGQKFWSDIPDLQHDEEDELYWKEWCSSPTLTAITVGSCHLMPIEGYGKDAIIFAQNHEPSTGKLFDTCDDI